MGKEVQRFRVYWHKYKTFAERIMHHTDHHHIMTVTQKHLQIWRMEKVTWMSDETIVPNKKKTIYPDEEN